jgi:hypothetical protein
VYNGLLTDQLYVNDSGYEGNDLSSLRAGVHTFDGVSFDIRGLVLLGSLHPALRYDYPSQVNGIPVGVSCSALHFLQATSWETAQDTVVGEDIIHYADHQLVRVPLIYGKNLADWWQWNDAPDVLSSHARVAWRGGSAASRRVKSTLRLFDFRWQNPRPEIEVTSIDFKSAMTVCAPFLLAITSE